MKLTEKDIQDSILEYLQLMPGCFVWRQNAGMAIREYKGNRHVFRSASVDGISDIIGIYRGRPLAIEVKRYPNKPTPKQRIFLEDFAKNGGIAIVAYNLQQVADILQSAQVRSLGHSLVFVGVFYSEKPPKS